MIWLPLATKSRITRSESAPSLTDSTCWVVTVMPSFFRFSIIALRPLSWANVQPPSPTGPTYTKPTLTSLVAVAAGAAAGAAGLAASFEPPQAVKVSAVINEAANATLRPKVRVNAM